MKAMYKSELARLAGVSSRTFARYLAAHREELAKLGVTPYTRKLRGKAVQFIVGNFAAKPCSSSLRTTASICHQMFSPAEIKESALWQIRPPLTPPTQEGKRSENFFYFLYFCGTLK